jgi:hypothetical protein
LRFPLYPFVFLEFALIILLPYTIVMNNIESKREKAREKTRHRFTWFDNVPTSTRVRLYSIIEPLVPTNKLLKIRKKNGLLKIHFHFKMSLYLSLY